MSQLTTGHIDDIAEELLRTSHMQQPDVDSFDNLQEVIVPVLGSVLSVYSALKTNGIIVPWYRHS